MCATKHKCGCFSRLETQKFISGFIAYRLSFLFTENFMRSTRTDIFLVEYFIGSEFLERFSTSKTLRISILSVNLSIEFQVFCLRTHYYIFSVYVPIIYSSDADDPLSCLFAMLRDIHSDVGWSINSHRYGKGCCARQK